MTSETKQDIMSWSYWSNIQKTAKSNFNLQNNAPHSESWWCCNSWHQTSHSFWFLLESAADRDRYFFSVYQEWEVIDSLQTSRLRGDKLINWGGCLFRSTKNDVIKTNKLTRLQQANKWLIGLSLLSIWKYLLSHCLMFPFHQNVLHQSNLDKSDRWAA